MAAGAKLRDASVCLSLPHDAASVWVARHALADELAVAGVHPQVRDDSLLVLSEIVSNSVKHAAPLAGGHVAVRWQLDETLVHIEVTDGGGGTQPRVSVAALSALGGRGLDLVRTLCLQWGVTEDEGSVTVWAEVPRALPDIDGHLVPPGALAH